MRRRRVRTVQDREDRIEREGDGADRQPDDQDDALVLASRPEPQLVEIGLRGQPEQEEQVDDEEYVAGRDQGKFVKDQPDDEIGQDRNDDGLVEVPMLLPVTLNV